NHVPTAIDDSFTTAEESPLTVAAAGVLGNDSDLDGDPITAVLVTGPTHGSLTLNADGSFTYTPNALFFGSGSFRYEANDGTVDSPTAVVSLTVTHVNHAPSAADENYSIGQAKTLTVLAPGVLGNDSDADGDPLSAVLVSPPSFGSLTLNSDGSFVYTPFGG